MKRLFSTLAYVISQNRFLYVDEQRRYWIAYHEAKEDADDIREDLGQEGMEVKIVSPVSHNTLTIVEEYVQ